MKFERFALAAVLLVAALFFAGWAAGAFANLGAEPQDNAPEAYVAVGIGAGGVAAALATAAVAVMAGWRPARGRRSFRVPVLDRERRWVAQLAGASLLVLLALAAGLAGSPLVVASALVPAALLAIAALLARRDP